MDLKVYDIDIYKVQIQTTKIVRSQQTKNIKIHTKRAECQ